MKIFWSWQSDRTQAVCRQFVREALEEAVKIIARDLDLQERPEIDSDVQGASGMADIVSTILSKIDESHVFVADLTPIAKADQGKVVPNPNVLIELGYAMKSLGPSQIVTVSNSIWKMRPEDLPFDIRQRRAPIYYRLAKEAGDEERQAVKGALVDQLVERLSACITSAIDEKDNSIEIVGRPSRIGDPSVWFNEGEVLRHKDWFGSGTETVSVVEGPRAYIRIIPSGWKDGVPDRHTMKQARSTHSLFTLGGGAANNGGITKDGSLLYSVKFNTKSTKDAAQWFSDTGEIWAFDGTVIFRDDDRTVFAYVAALKNWRAFLGQSIEALNHFGAEGPILVEAGLTRLEAVFWPGRFMSEFSESIDDQIISKVAASKWDAAEQEMFLIGLYNKMAISFGKSPTKIVELESLIEALSR